MIAAGGQTVRQCGHLGPFSAHETQTIKRQCAHCRVPDSDGCLWQTIHAVAALRSERMILQKKIANPTVAKPAIVQRRMTTAIFVAAESRNHHYCAHSAARAAVVIFGRLRAIGADMGFMLPEYVAP